MKSIAKHDITAVILAGGRSTRMNGQDKGLIDFNNKPLIAYVAKVIYKSVDSILVSANRNIDLYQEFGEVVSDELNDFQGPLAGIAAALNKTKTDYLLVVPCDGPFVKKVLISRLVDAMSTSHSGLCVATDGKKMHPTYALINISQRDNLNDFLAQGERKLGLWYRDNNAQQVDFSDYQSMFINFNSLEDMKK